ncbi:hypothetical protein, partial [Comamonas sp. CAH-2]|uniref:hypothetical protein n=1 Tax=Comamonas sp. CAH-2 TaxID=2605745 RepID=UPI001EEC561E
SWEGAFLFSQKPLVLAKFLHGFLSQLVKPDLFGKDIDRYIDRSADSPAALIVIEDGVETGPIAIKKVFVSKGVEIPHPAFWVPKKSFWKLTKCLKLCLESKPANVYDDSFPTAVLLAGSWKGGGQWLIPIASSASTAPLG